eukprot:CAMPEP_0177706432 /NCGR_PEP_ID=MMETSP0484_2-20121128/9223_1 /TAXON_ID=354590 /ORGANISM="Rhodomonas lens, Strain RHODO" /LENGTH=372 /DNA_ID=CAMNT_0019217895 /DNA_START=149 /DNA_END=1269 /DNA_ORIENTATION=-
MGGGDGDAMDLEEESKIEQYADMETIGSGKFATVHRARHVPTGRMVALKKVQIFENIMDTQERHEVVREAKMLQKVDHQNIIKCYDSWIERGEFYVCLELCSSGDLQEVLKGQKAQHTKLPPNQVFSFAYQLTDALNHMHSMRMMHRDIKPANVFLGEGGVLKLGDLGLGRSFSSRTLEANTVVGTPYYMAPEVMDNSSYAYPADVWSLGCVLYELCMLESPFYEKNVNLYQLYNKIKSAQYAPLDPQYGEVVAALVRAMLTVDTPARPTLEQVKATLSQRNDKHGSGGVEPGALLPPRRIRGGEQDPGVGERDARGKKSVGQISCAQGEVGPKGGVTDSAFVVSGGVGGAAAREQEGDGAKGQKGEAVALQ